MEVGGATGHARGWVVIPPEKIGLGEGGAVDVLLAGPAKDGLRQ